MKTVLLLTRFAAGGAILSVSLVGIGAALFGHSTSDFQDVIVALAGGFLTAALSAKSVGLFA